MLRRHWLKWTALIRSGPPSLAISPLVDPKDALKARLKYTAKAADLLKSVCVFL